MLRCLFSTLFLLLVCSTFCAFSSYAGGPGAGSPVKESVEIFKDSCVIKLDLAGGSANPKDNKIKKVDNVFFVTTDKMLVSVAEVNYQENSKDFKYNFVAAYVETTKANLEEQIFKEPSGVGCGGWTTQFATKNTEKIKSFSALKNVVYDAKNKKIYLLVVNKVLEASGEQWKYNIVVGTVSESGGGKPITWDETKKENDEIKFEKKLKSTKGFIESFSTYGGGFVTNNKTIVFMLKTVKQENSENAVAFVELKGSDSNNLALEVLHVEDTAGTCYPYLFSWDEKIVMITTNCTAKADPKVKESTDMTNWEESKGPFLFLSDFFKDKTSFITTDINSRNVLLFAQKKEQCFTTERKKQNCFAFWFSDGNRTYNIGENVFHDNEKIVSSSLVFAKEKLFFLHQQSDGDKKFFMTRLDKQLQNITATLDTWKSADDVVLNLCKSVTSNSEMSCSAPLPTKGLVGFLSNENDNSKEWKDRYLYVNAEIQKGAKFQKGLKCSGAGQGATWPVGKADKDQPYNFAKYGFTLVATVTIDGNAESNMFNSILGIGLKQPASAGATNNIGLLCDEHNKFVVNYKTETPSIKTETNCVLSKKYIIALVLKGENLEIYVDGITLTLPNAGVSITKTETIEDFYFGAASGTTTLQKTAVTTSNVLLYNWPFDNEIEKLKPKRNEEEIVQTQPENENTKPETSDENTQGNKDVKKDTKTGGTENEEEENKQSPPTAEDSAVRVGVVGVLSLCCLVCSHCWGVMYTDTTTTTVLYIFICVKIIIMRCCYRN